MTAFATTKRVLLGTALLLMPALAQAQAIHDTGTVQFEVFADGDVGTDSPSFAGTGFVFEGDNGLFTGQFVVGADPTQVSGVYYGEGEWVSTSGPTALSEPFDDPFEDSDQGFESVYNDSGATNPIGLEITERSYSEEDDAFAIIEYEIANTSGSDLTGIYPGLFIDWDVGSFANNLAGFNDANNLLYVYDESGGSTNYFGMAALGDVTVSGVFYDALGGAETDIDIYTFLTTISPDPGAADDRRVTLGVGPYDIAMGESVVLRFAVVGGASEKEIIANAGAAQALVADPIDVAIHDTGDVQFEMFADGDVGTDSPSFAGTGFVFEGDNGLFTGQFVVGADPTQVSGVYYGEGEWVTTEPLAVAGPPAGFDQAFSAEFTDEGATNPIGLEIDQLSYSSAGDSYVIVSYEIENTTDSDLTGIYPGLFIDWDVGSFANNLAGYDEDTKLLYVYDESGGSTNYFGMAALGDVTVSGVFYDALGGAETDIDIYTFLTTISPDPGAADDRRVTLGVGPYDIASGEAVTVEFAIVGGEDLDDILANAAEAQGFDVASEETTVAGTFRLHSAYPNPVSGSATLGFSLPDAQQVNLTVYDLLGRRVATLVDGMRQAGEQSVTFDASALPSGVYVYRLQAGSTQLTERFTVTR